MKSAVWRTEAVIVGRHLRELQTKIHKEECSVEDRGSYSWETLERATDKDTQGRVQLEDRGTYSWEILERGCNQTTTKRSKKGQRKMYLLFSTTETGRGREKVDSLISMCTMMLVTLCSRILTSVGFSPGAGFLVNTLRACKCWIDLTGAPHRKGMPSIPQMPVSMATMHRST